MLNRIPTWLLLVLPGLLLWLAWPPIGIFIFLFLGFVPLFELHQRYAHRGRWAWFWRMYTALFIWNLLSTWWVWNSSDWGAVVMLLANSFLMCFPWMLMRFSRRFVSVPRTEILFIIFWLLFETLHQRWDLSWPWLTLGNGFAGATWFVQWYDVTGTMGGSFLILLVNVWLYRWLGAGSVKAARFAGLLVGVLALVSLLRYYTYSPNHQQNIQVVALQPSFDPWNEKFVRDSRDMIAEMVKISSTQVDSNTDLLVWPETSLTENIELINAGMDYQVRMLDDFRKKYPKLEILTGADMQQVYRNCKKRPSSTARPTGTSTIWWDSYNSALFIDKNSKVAFYHKSKLVPGTEQMPLTNWFPAINDLAVTLDENSTTGSLGTSDSVVLFGKNKIIPAICYESIYGDYLTQFARKGGGAIAVITNDAWWGNTPGYQQHMAYAKLRAIEQRKWVVRSANTGTSCFIDSKGNVLQATNWFEKKAIRQKISLSNDLTLYTRFGDLPIILFFILISLSIFIFNKHH